MWIFRGGSNIQISDGFVQGTLSGRYRRPVSSAVRRGTDRLIGGKEAAAMNVNHDGCLCHSGQIPFLFYSLSHDILSRENAFHQQMERPPISSNSALSHSPNEAQRHHHAQQQNRTDQCSPFAAVSCYPGREKQDKIRKRLRELVTIITSNSINRKGEKQNGA